MSFLDRILSRPAVGDKPIKSGRRVPGDETRPVQMSLEERMQLRREMMFEAVQATLLDAGLPNSSVKFKVVAADKRGHSYAVMVDLPVPAGPSIVMINRLGIQDVPEKSAR